MSWPLPGQCRHRWESMACATTDGPRVCLRCGQREGSAQDSFWKKLGRLFWPSPSNMRPVMGARGYQPDPPSAPPYTPTPAPAPEDPRTPVTPEEELAALEEVEAALGRPRVGLEVPSREYITEHAVKVPVTFVGVPPGARVWVRSLLTGNTLVNAPHDDGREDFVRAITCLPDDEMVFRVRHPGFVPYEGRISPPQDAPTTVTVAMQSDRARLPTSQHAPPPPNAVSFNVSNLQEGDGMFIRPAPHTAPPQRRTRQTEKPVLKLRPKRRVDL